MFGICGACIFALAGCMDASSEGETTDESSVATYADIENMDLEYTDRDKRDTYDEASATKITLQGESIELEGDGASVEGSCVTVTSEGTYVVSGELTNGQLRVNTGDTEKVQIVLAGAQIHNETGAALFIEQTDKCFITLAADTNNVLSDGAEYALAEGEDEPNAALFSKDDLTINGSGELAVTGNYQHAIYSKDDLVITGGTFDIAAVEDGLRGKDCLKILSGTFTVDAGEDCLKSSRDDDPARGFVCIDGGTFSLSAGDDAIHGETYLRVSNGDIEVSKCNEGLEAMVVQLDEGDIHVVSEDDAINAAAPSDATNDQVDPATADQGTPSQDTRDEELVPNRNMQPQGERESSLEKSSDREGKDGQTLGDTSMEPPTDISVRPDEGSESPGENRDDGSSLRSLDDSGQEGGGIDSQRQTNNGGPTEGNENCQLIINGATLTLEAKGDALDSNGSLEINGGTVFVTGPTSNGDGALDYALDATCNGGQILIVGSAGMAQDFSKSTQPSAFVRVNGLANQEISVADQSGKVLLSYTPTAAFETLIVSSPDFVDGQEYILTIGNTTTEFAAATK